MEKQITVVLSKTCFKLATTTISIFCRSLCFSLMAKFMFKDKNKQKNKKQKPENKHRSYSISTRVYVYIEIHVNTHAYVCIHMSETKGTS